MAYSVACTCTKVHQLSAGDAGTSFACSCGQVVEVPSLSVLRSEKGEFTASPELILESMLAKGELPADAVCVLCHADCETIRYFNVVCERIEFKKELGGCGYLAFFLLVGWGGALYAALRDSDQNRQQVGRNVGFRLPLRICSACDYARNNADLKQLLCKVPVYAYLFDKYPQAKINPV